MVCIKILLKILT